MKSGELVKRGLIREGGLRELLRCVCLLINLTFLQDFVLQLEGKQTWSLYKATEELSRELNPSIDKDEVGEKLYDVKLEVNKNE